MRLSDSRTRPDISLAATSPAVLAVRSSTWFRHDDRAIEPSYRRRSDGGGRTAVAGCIDALCDRDGYTEWAAHRPTADFAGSARTSTGSMREGPLRGPLRGAPRTLATAAIWMSDRRLHHAFALPPDIFSSAARLPSAARREAERDLFGASLSTVSAAIRSEIVSPTSPCCATKPLRACRPDVGNPPAANASLGGGRNRL